MEINARPLCEPLRSQSGFEFLWIVCWFIIFFFNNPPSDLAAFWDLIHLLVFLQ